MTAPARRLAIAIALFGITLLVFSRALSCGFTNCDDPPYVLRNEHVRAGLTLETLRWAWSSTEAANWHPATWVSHALDCTLWGLNPAGHHATSVVIHALNAVLVFLVLSRITRTCWASALCAAFFALHPLRVESVVWVAERKDVLSAFFWWLTIGCYAAYAERRVRKETSAWRWYAASLALFALALLSKPMVVTLPFVLLLLDFWPLQRLAPELHAAGGAPDRRMPQKIVGNGSVRERRARRSSRGILQAVISPRKLGHALIEKCPFLFLSVISSLLTYKAQQQGGAMSEHVTMAARLSNAAISVPHYLTSILVPTDMAVLYPRPEYWSSLKVAASVGLITAISWLALWQVRRRPWLLVGWMWFLGMLVPVSGIVTVGAQAYADRYTYLPMTGLLIAVCWTVHNAFASHTASRRVAGVCIPVLILLGVLTWRQQAVWKDSEPLFRHAIRVTSNNWFAWNGLGLALNEQGRYPEAIASYQESIRINPDLASTYNNLGQCIAEAGSPERALSEYATALRMDPGLKGLHGNIANALADLGRNEEALIHYQWVIQQDPRNEDALSGCGKVLMTLGRFNEAEDVLRRALELPLQPGTTDTRSNLASVYAMTGRLSEAAREFQAVLAAEPRNAKAHNNLANTLAGTGALTDALSHYQQAIEYQPEYPEAYCNLGIVFARLGRINEARAALRKALEQQADFAPAREALQQLGSFR